MTRIWLWFRLMTAILLFVAIAEMEYYFYSLLRVATTIAALEALWVAQRTLKHAWLLPFAAMAVLWNPIWKIELPKETWRFLDVAAACLLLASIRFVAEAKMFLASVKLRHFPYIQFTLAVYGSLLLLLAFPLIFSHSTRPLDEPWRTALLIAMVAVVVGIFISKAAYIAHVIRNPNVKFKVVWTLGLLLVHFWSELIYYYQHIRRSSSAQDATNPLQA